MERIDVARRGDDYEEDAMCRASRLAACRAVISLVAGEPRQVPIIQSTTFKYDESMQLGELFDLKKLRAISILAFRIQRSG